VDAKHTATKCFECATERPQIGNDDTKTFEHRARQVGVKTGRRERTLSSLRLAGRNTKMFLTVGFNSSGYRRTRWGQTDQRGSVHLALEFYCRIAPARERSAKETGDPEYALH
jgi:hypothetical protein